MVGEGREGGQEVEEVTDQGQGGGVGRGEGEEAIGCEMIWSEG